MLGFKISMMIFKYFAAIDEEEEFIPPNIFSNVKTRVTLDMSLRAISSNSNPLNLVDPNWEPDLLELIGMLLVVVNAKVRYHSS